MYKAETSQKPIYYLATYGMWLITAVLAVLQISVMRQIVLSIYTTIVMINGENTGLKTAFQATALEQGVTIVMGILAIVIIIGGFEYHHRRVGDPKSLKILGWTLGVQSLILLAGVIL
jgi:hypothetical protein